MVQRNSSPDTDNKERWTEHSSPSNGELLEKRWDEQTPALGLSFRNLHVHGFNTADQYQQTVASYLLKLPRLVVSLLRKGPKESVQILQDFNGILRNGEMLLVLGRPGSGCTTFLKTLAGNTHGINIHPSSQINYQGVSYQQMHQDFKGQSIYLAELDVHFPELTLGQTLAFAAGTRTGRSRDNTPYDIGHNLASSFNLDRAFDTRIGNGMIRGVSGGERKRTSIAEAFISGSQIQCWDNSTRGLDSSTALSFIKLLRSSTNASKSTVVMSIYQASEPMYKHFDKVTLLYEGRQIYYGHVSSAAEYFIGLGFVRPSRATTADFLTSITHPAERIVKNGYEMRVPRLPDEFASLWRRSEQAKLLLEDIHLFNTRYPPKTVSIQNGLKGDFRTIEKSSLQSSTFPIPIYLQIAICIKRELLRLRNNYPPVVAGVVGNTIVAVILGSIFYQLEENTGSFEQRAMLIFFAIMMNALTPAFEVLTIWAQRPIVEKHNQYTFYHPFADACASVLCDLPNKIITSVTFNSVLYFMTNLRKSAPAFFIFYFFSLVTILSMSMFFRMVGSLSRTSEQTMAPVSIMILIYVTYAGYVIPLDHMTNWLQWLRWINPIAYAYESLMINEFDHREFFCSSLVPTGSPYSQNGMEGKVCAVVGALSGEQLVRGSAYIKLKYGFTSTHLWRNLIILFAMTIIFGAVHLLAAEYIPAARSKGEILLFRRGKTTVKTVKDDVEKVVVSSFPKDTSLAIAKRESNDDTLRTGKSSLATQSEVFLWHKVNYEIKSKRGVKKILSEVDGWVKPGTLTALMGATGAGKTSLLDVLADRVSIGIVSGEIYVGGRPRDKSFQRKTGYVQQDDIHLATATVREALEFSALLRQSNETAADRLKYVDTVLNMLDMEAYSNAIVGVPGEGLNVDQRKRLTIAVEMVAKPELLLFLDEPTSGLDSQTAWSICMLLRKLADNGQAILCTIHQPSSQLFQIFDRLLLLGNGGSTLYFGDIGRDASTVINYFTKNRAITCGPDENPAEWVLNVTGGISSGPTLNDCFDLDWPEIWRNSREKEEIQRHIAEFKLSAFQTTSAQTNPGDEEYAASFTQQVVAALRRIFQEYWRDPVYLYSKVALCAGVALCTGISFYMTRLDIQGLRNIFFSAFVLTQLFSTVDQQIIPRLIAERGLFEARERRSKTYSWVVFLTTNIVVEIFWQTLTSVLVYVAWYYPTGLWRNGDVNFTVSERGALTFVILWLFCLFISTFSQAVSVGMEHAETAVQIATLFFYLCLIFCGVIVTPADLPRFWIFMYRVSPLTYFIGGIVTAGLANTSITCSSIEMLRIHPPTAITCGQYMAAYIQSAGGYISNPIDSSDCMYCPISDTNTFLAINGINIENRWRNAAFLLVYVVINIVATFTIYWAVRVPRVKRDPSS
ncbi:hypothetical protein M501DRAFT_995996 [Patellaria atrata CBS 101060]|uniref:ABC transporter domain-containing protein n=1 Tax=Patellaria atrata CBS 101060 TaxID=1346257 RepID=A0A9P4S7F2_9PEZI|nr:hypothetical protein M501DRAFT_995996 [Patellaria atrata CBS 101060]